jgi:hypothetical protein
MTFRGISRHVLIVLILILIAGTAARVTIAITSRDNFLSEDYKGLHDIKAWVYAGNMILDGRNPYKESYILDFAPVWAWICAFPVALAGKLGLDSFGASVFIKIILTITDITLLLFIIEISLKVGKNPILPSALFFLNPVSLFITGYLGQFDSVSMVPVFIIAYMMSRSSKTDWIDSNGKAVKTGLLLGASIAVKHASGPLILFMFRMFSGMKRYILSISIAVCIFIVVFLPYIVDGGTENILDDVFGQQQRIHETGWFMIFSSLGVNPSGFLLKVLWCFVLLFTALIVRKSACSNLEVIALYYVSIVLFVPSFAAHYLIYPILFGVLTYPVFTSAYTLTATVFLLSTERFSGSLALMNTPMHTLPLFLVLAAWWISIVLRGCRKTAKQISQDR